MLGLAILAGVLGLVVGSFLNVVIKRYPGMLMAEWHRECLVFLKLPEEPKKFTENLLKPHSHCLKCHHPLNWFYNIPLVSYLWLRGRCAYCQQSISIQYPLIELLTAITTLMIFIQFGLSLQTIAAWLFTWILISLAGIDWQTQLLPDPLTLSGLWLGLLVNCYQLFVAPATAIVGAAMGYLFFWIVAQLFAKLRHKQGMGHGDFKMLALLGAWLGPLPLLYVVILASLINLLAMVYLLIFQKMTRDNPVPFGPALALAGWVILVYGSPLTNWITL